MDHVGEDAGVDDTRDCHVVAARAGDGDGEEGLVGRCGDAHSLAPGLAVLDGDAVPQAARVDDRAKPDEGEHLVVDHGGEDGGTHGGAATGKAAGGHVLLGVVVGQDADGTRGVELGARGVEDLLVAALGIPVGADDGADAVGRDDHGNGAAQGRVAAGGAAHRDDDRVVLGLGVDEHVARLGDELGTLADDCLDLTVEHEDVDDRAGSRLGGAGQGHGHRDHEALGVGGDRDVLVGLDVGALVDDGVGDGARDAGVDDGRDAHLGAGGGGGQDVDHELGGAGGDPGEAVGGDERRGLAHAGDGLGLLDEGLDRAAHTRLLACADREGDGQELGVVLGGHDDVAAGFDGHVVGDLGLVGVLHHDDGDDQAHTRVAGGGDARRHGDDHDVGGLVGAFLDFVEATCGRVARRVRDLGVDVRVATNPRARADVVGLAVLDLGVVGLLVRAVELGVGLRAMRGHDDGAAGVDGGGVAGVVVGAHGRGGGALVGEDRDAGARAHLGGGDRERAGDHAHVGAAHGLDLEVAREVDGAAVADERLDGVVGEDEGKAAGRVERGVAAGLDGAGDGLDVVVGGAQEVEEVDGTEHRVGVDVELDGVLLLAGGGVVLLGEGDEGLVLGLGDPGIGLGALLDARLDGVEVGPVLADGVVGEGDHDLLGVDDEVVGLDGAAVADVRAHDVVAVDQGEGGAYAHRGAAGGHEGAGADGELGLVVGLDGDVAASIDRAALDDGRAGLAVGDEHRDGAGHGGGGAAAGGRARDGLGAEQAGEDAVHVLGVGAPHVDVARSGDVRGMDDRADDGRVVLHDAEGGDGLVVVHAHGHGRADGRGGTLAGRRGTGGVGAVVGLVGGVHVKAGGREGAHELCDGLVVGDVGADGGCDHDLLAALVALAGTAGLARGLGVGRLVGVVGDGRGGLAAGGLLLGLDVLGLEDVGREGGTRLGTHATQVGDGAVGVLVGVLVLVELVVDVVLGLVVALLLGGVGQGDVAVGNLVAEGVDVHQALVELGEVALEVGADGGGGAHGLVLAVLEGVHEDLAGGAAGAGEAGDGIARGNVHGDGGAHGGVATAREAGGLGEGGAVGLGVDGDAVALLANVDRVVGELEVCLVVLPHLDVTAGGDERAARGEGRLGGGVHDVEGDRSVEGDVLGLAAVLERVGAGDREGLGLVGGGGVQVEGAGLHDAALADRGGRVERAVDHGEACARAHALAAVGVGGAAAARLGGVGGGAAAGRARAGVGAVRLGGGRGALVSLAVGVLVLVWRSAVLVHHRRGGHGVEGGGGLGGHGDDAARGDVVVTRGPVVVGDGGRGLEVGHRDGDGARDAHVGGAGACDGPRGDGAGRSGLALAEDLADEAEEAVADVGEGLVDDGVADLDDAGDVTGEEGLHLAEVEEVAHRVGRDALDELVDVGAKALQVEEGAGDAELLADDVEDRAAKGLGDLGLVAGEGLGEVLPTGLELLHEGAVDEAREAGEPDAVEEVVGDLLGHLGHVLDEEVEDVLVPVHLLLGVVELSGEHGDGTAGVDGGVADGRIGVTAHDVDGDARADADPRVGDGGVGDDLGVGVAVGDDRDVARGLDDEAVSDLGEGVVVVDGKAKGRGDGDAALGGLCGLAVRGQRVGRATREALGTGECAERLAAAECLVRLLVRRGLLLTLRSAG